METADLVRVIRQVMQEELLDVKEDISVMKGDILVMKEDISVMKEDISVMKARQDNRDGLINALLHRTEELSALYDSLLHNTASKEAITRIEAKLDVLAYRIFEQEADIHLLKKPHNSRLIQP